MTHESSSADRIEKTDAQWRETLTDEQYHVARQAGTERAFTGRFWDHHEPGTYYAVGGTLPLFSSSTKFDSGTGWPSFSDVVNADHVVLHEDISHGMKRIEVRDAQTGHHLGHLFHDGPAPTGLRFCINSAALRFEPAEEEPDQGPRP